jgi:formate C-acetyltransferase
MMKISETMAMLAVSPRIERLRARLETDFAATPGINITDAEEGRAFARLAFESYSRSVGKPRILRRAEFLAHFAAHFPVARREDELIVGSQRFTAPPWRELFAEEPLRQAGIHGNHGHIIVDYGRVVRDGIPGLRQAIAGMPEGENRAAFSMSLESFATFVCRHGFPELNDRAPATFSEALQLTWFVQIFLSAEGLGSAISFGRLDQFLWPFLEADLNAGRCAPEQAFELVCAFCLKCCEGGESQNLAVGGPGENLLSLLLLRAMRTLKVWQPSLSVRIGAGSSDAFWEEALALCEIGIGMPSFFNDPVVIQALEKLGIPRERAADYGIVGCYEATPQGDACPYTVGGGFALTEIFNDYLRSRPPAPCFEDFKEGFKAYFAETYRNRILPEFVQRLLSLERDAISPFESLCVTGCIESGRAAEQAGARFNLFGVNILGIGTLVDSLLAVKTLVFDEQALPLAELAGQVERDFPDETLRQRCRGLPGKFGSDAPVSNALARELSACIAGEVLASRLPHGVRPYPGFFWFGVDIGGHFPATADGRRAGERPSYGCGPGIMLEHRSITAILNSAAHIAHASCACGNPLTLSFNRNELSGANGRKLLRQAIEAYFCLGGFHVQINIVAAGDLRKAKAAPERYQDLTVRISGLSARFVNLDAKWQDAIIERTERGM